MDLKKFSTSMQYRPKDSTDRRMYNPDRDIAYLGSILMQLTTNSFYKDGESFAELDALSEEEQEQFTEMVIAVGTFCKDFMRGERTFPEALEAAGLSKFPPKLWDMWLAGLGHTFMSAFYHGCRGVMMKGNPDDPMPYDRIFDTAEELRKNLKGGE